MNYSFKNREILITGNITIRIPYTVRIIDCFGLAINTVHEHSEG